MSSEIICRLDSFENTGFLSKTDQILVKEAESAMERAYAPYSNFFVGAAILLDNGKVITGNNQENAAYPSGLCAERVAAFSASSLFPSAKFIAIAICARSGGEFREPVSPCGSCRQSLMEYEIKFKTPVKVIMKGENGKVIVSESVINLLPLAFYSKDLK